MLKKSPSGSVCPYNYMGGELHPLKYGSYYSDKYKLLQVMQAEEKFILRSPGRNNRRIWIDFYKTTLDDEVIRALVWHIKAIRHKIFKLCFVGCSFFTKRKIRRQLAAVGLESLALQVQFFSNPEKAKQWLVSEGFRQ